MYPSILDDTFISLSFNIITCSFLLKFNIILYSSHSLIYNLFNKSISLLYLSSEYLIFFPFI
jgi:hypothetical protein